jgi:hypothetical protein
MTPLIVAGAFAVGEFGPALGVGIGGTIGYNSIKAWNRVFGIEEGARKAAEEFFDIWRNEWVTNLIAARASKIHGTSASPYSRRLLHWNNLGIGPDEDVVEALVIREPGLACNQVRFEFTALPHITWDKKLRIISQDGQVEELNVTKDVRHATSRVLHLEQDWPLQVQSQKCLFPGFFKNTHEPETIPPFPGLGGCIVLFIFIAVKPNNC